MPLKRGFLREFITFIILYFVNLGLDFSVVFEAREGYLEFVKLLRQTEYKGNNGTENFLDCSKGPWNYKDYANGVNDFGIVIIVGWVFLAIAVILSIMFTTIYVIMIFKSKDDPDFFKEEGKKYVRIKFCFGFACSMLQDIPMTCLAVDMLVARLGPTGLLCWQCAQDNKCTGKDVLQVNIDRITALLSLSLLTTVAVNAYKGVTTFYRWTRVQEAKCYEIRGCVSLFVGCIYALIITTPSLALIKYKLFLMPSQSANMFVGLVDSLFLIGIISWVIFVVVAFCCPLVSSIRM